MKRSNQAFKAANQRNWTTDELSQLGMVNLNCDHAALELQEVKALNIRILDDYMLDHDFTSASKVVM